MFRRILHSLRGLPERTRSFLAGTLIFFAALGIFASWGAITASKLASLSNVFAPSGEHTERKLDNPESVVEQLKGGFRDMAALFSGGIFSGIPDIPDALPDEGSGSGAPNQTGGDQTQGVPESGMFTDPFFHNLGSDTGVSASTTEGSIFP